MLQVLDSLWKEHLQTMDQLRQGIHLRAYANKPKNTSVRLLSFSSPVERLKGDVIRIGSFADSAKTKQKKSSVGVVESCVSSSLSSTHRRRLCLFDGQPEPLKNGHHYRVRLNRPWHRWFVTSLRSVETIHVLVAAVKSTNSVAEHLAEYERAIIPHSARGCAGIKY